MKRLFLAGVLALISGATGLMAQKQPQPKSQKELTAAESKRVKGGLVVVAKDQPAPPKKDILIGM